MELNSVFTVIKKTLTNFVPDMACTYRTIAKLQKHVEADPLVGCGNIYLSRKKEGSDG